MTSKLKIDLNVNSDAGFALPSVFRSYYNKVVKCIFFLYEIENIRKSVLRYYVTCTCYEKFLIRKRNLLRSFFLLFQLFLILLSFFSLSRSLSITLALAASHFSHPLLHHCHTTAPFICEATRELRIALKRERKERKREKGRKSGDVVGGDADEVEGDFDSKGGGRGWLRNGGYMGRDCDAREENLHNCFQFTRAPCANEEKYVLGVPAVQSDTVTTDIPPPLFLLFLLLTSLPLLTSSHRFRALSCFSPSLPPSLPLSLSRSRLLAFTRQSVLPTRRLFNDLLTIVRDIIIYN